MTDTPFQGFQPAALTFFRDLKRHNAKPWFEAHRETYDTEVKRPLQLLVDEIDARLGALAPEMVGHRKRSVFRIHRDIRFSKDKSPYKTHAAVWFFHRDAGHGVGTQAAHGGAGFYFHLEPGASFLGGGIWMPPTPTLKRLREVIADDYEELDRLVRAPAFRRVFGRLSDDGKLTRLPRGFDQDHPAGEWLRHKSFTAGCELTEAQVLSPTLPDLLIKQYTVMLPFVRWLNHAIGLRSQQQR